MNKRKMIFAGLFGFVFVFTIMMLSGFASADAIYIKSSNRNFDSDQPGSWRVTKSAEWIGKGKARLTLKAESKMIDAGGARDVVYILDTSKSMENTIGALKTAMKYSADDVLSNSNNTMSLITYNSSAQIVQEMTNNVNTIKNAIDGVGVAGDTNYYDAILKLEDLLTNYQERAGRTLVVVFISDGRPGIQTPLEAAEYRVFKSRFPNSVVNGVQFNYYGVLEQLKTVSDYQIKLDYKSEEELRVQFAEAVKTAYNFDTFELTDIIDTSYFTIGGIEASMGSAAKSGNTISWNMNGLYRTGTTEELTIDVTLKDTYLTGSQNEFSPNTKTTIRTHLEDVPDENVENTTSPKLTLRFDVKYEANAPIDCTVSGTLPSTTRQIVFDVVPISQNKLQCPGYNFKRWVIANDGVRRINEDYFLMPNEVVTIKAVWEKIGIDKSTEGDVYGTYDAILEQGWIFGEKMKKIAGTAITVTNNYTADSNIKAIKRASSLPVDFTATSDNTISLSSSKLPIYIWFDASDGTIYYYSSADRIKTSSHSLHYSFIHFDALTDISGLSEWDTSGSVSMQRLFEGSPNIDFGPIANWDVSNVTMMYSAFDLYNEETWTNEPTDLRVLANWDVSNCENFNSLFSGRNISHLEGLANWNTSSAKYMNNTFSRARGITNLDALSNWDVSHVERMDYMFEFNSDIENLNGLRNWNTSSLKLVNNMFWGATSLTDISALANWDVSHVESFGRMFDSASSLTDISPLRNWSFASATSLSYMFANCTSLANLSPLANWNVSNVENFGSIFSGMSSLTDISPLRNWNLLNARDIGGMFYGDSGISDISPIGNWNVSNVEYFGSIFGSMTSLTDISPLRNWNTSSATSMGSMFVKTKISDLTPLANWDVSHVTDMRMMFWNMPYLRDLTPLANWDVSNVENFEIMFAHSYGIQSVAPLSGWDMGSATNINQMFINNYAVNDLSPLNNWAINSSTSMVGTFDNIPASVTRPTWYHD